ncbi:hypothetical protein [Amycolatopsis sp. NBC_00438]|uniref:hypothetical protein n=1 Tax=Amycolatopsis sp. NBC_00438 TaxID=2903558 RepID=UPI002E1C128D
MPQQFGQDVLGRGDDAPSWMDAGRARLPAAGQLGGGRLGQRRVAQFPVVRAPRRKPGQLELLDEDLTGVGEQDLRGVVGDWLGRGLQAATAADQLERDS